MTNETANICVHSCVRTFSSGSDAIQNFPPSPRAHDSLVGCRGHDQATFARPMQSRYKHCTLPWSCSHNTPSPPQASVHNDRMYIIHYYAGAAWAPYMVGCHYFGLALGGTEMTARLGLVQIACPWPRPCYTTTPPHTLPPAHSHSQHNPLHCAGAAWAPYMVGCHSFGLALGDTEMTARLGLVQIACPWPRPCYTTTPSHPSSPTHIHRLYSQEHVALRYRVKAINYFPFVVRRLIPSPPHSV